jgi:hypothetical protein
MMPAEHCESALQRIQRIVTLASRESAPITSGEAYEQIVEELELAGFGSPEIDPSLFQGEPQAARH